MARRKTDAEIRAWIAETNRILDEVEAMDPNDPSLAPFKTKNWIDKGWPALRLHNPDGTFYDPVGDRIRKEGDK